MSPKAWETKIKKIGDVTFDNGMPNDIIIPVMGPTGVGKSTFINTAAGETVTAVGHDLRSCTVNIQHAICRCPSDPSRRVILVDTPGFDDTFEDDLEILRRIAVWLASSYGRNMKLAGILYLHDISQTRMSGTACKNLNMFRRLCGENAEKNVVLVTTKWGCVTEDVGGSREKQLKSNPDFWQQMVKNGSKDARFHGSHGSAWDAMKPILANNAANPVVEAIRIQKELVDLGKMIPETDAGNALRSALKEVADKHRRAVEGLSRKVDDDEQKRRLEETEKELRQLLRQIQELKLPLGMRIKKWLGLGKSNPR